jgi:general secretion pathway protein E
VLHTKQTDPKSGFDAVASRIKLLSGMDIAERRLPQDGRQTIRFAGQDIDLRVSALPGSWGESLVMRLLKKETELPDLEAIGLEGHSKTTLQDLLSQPNGVILVTGPTGSGKSTTLYRGLRGLNDGVRKIITIEDPVEYDMDGIIQIQTNSGIGFSFAKGLRAILRQDPDIIMVGEIRDAETATIAAQAALTGHLVLSTLHTNSALAAVARLVDIGLEPYMVISAVRGLVAQRLVRRLCPSCSVPVSKPEGEDMIWDMIKSGNVIDPQIKGKNNWRESKGCSDCSQTGYSGRIAIFETVKMDNALSEAILEGASLQKLLDVAREQGFITLLEDGILKARSGVTTLSEVFRVCGAQTSTLDLSGETQDA